MRVVRNTGYIRRQQRTSRFMVWVGVLILGSTILVTQFAPQWIFFGYGLLILGFIVFSNGMQETTKWNSKPRADQAIDDLLRRLNDRYTMIHYPEMLEKKLVGKRPEHVLVYSGGILVIAARGIPGKFKVEGNRWKRERKGIAKIMIFGGDPLKNPSIDCVEQQRILKTFLGAKGIPVDDDLIDGMVAFPNPKAEVDVISSDLTVATAKDLYPTIRDLGSEARLHAKLRDQIIEVLSQGNNIEGPITLPQQSKGTKGAHAT
jgi:hypothetical protein